MSEIGEIIREVAREEMPPGFAVMYRGFWMTFENGYSISIQFCHGNYCDNENDEYSRRLIYVIGVNPPYSQCRNAEILISNRDGENITHEFAKDGDRIEHCDIGDVTPERLAEIIARIKRRKK